MRQTWGIDSPVAGFRDDLLFLAEFPASTSPDKARAAALAALGELGWSA